MRQDSQSFEERQKMIWDEMHERMERRRREWDEEVFTFLNLFYCIYLFHLSTSIEIQEWYSDMEVENVI